MKRREHAEFAAELRRRAEALVAARTTGTEPDDRDLRHLVQELEVHQVELEMQNDELRNTREEAELALERYTELFDFAPIGYVVVSPQGVMNALNFGAARTLGAARRELVGRSLFLYLGQDQHAAFRTLLSRVFERAGDTEATETCEVVLRSATGAIDVQLIATVPADQTPAAALIALRDISARKRAETALREEARRKDDFLAALSHELRNPLAAIVNSLYVLQRARGAGERALKATEIIGRQVSQLVHIVDDLLDVTRIARGKVHLERQRCELGELVERAIEDHRPTFEAAGIALGRLLDGERLWVDADVTRIVQVIGNLFSNALKFTPRLGRVEVAVRREGAMAAVSVRDTGIGIGKEMRAHLFEPFMQGPQSIDRKRGGLGLGLTMVKGLVELHGGTIEVASDGPGHGAEFTFRLPLVAPPDATAPSAEQPRVRQHRVLVIEDNVDAAESLRELLSLHGHDVVIALDGQTGLSCAKDLLPDVVLCDIGLPGMDGYEVARAIRADHALGRTYLVALSGYALPEDGQRAAEAGFDCHIAKPPNAQRLAQVIGDAPLLGRSDRH